ncbi:MAG: DEAD/DEAH box helicase [Desulfobacterales bacterium]|nr:DEAD/DEAH box helicase [Desulfobacterales bacterium]
MTFQTFKLNERVIDGVVKAGYVTPTPIQTKAIPPVMDGRDVMGLAQTGTGKTAAFVLPMLHRFLDGPSKRVRALIIAPTRELAEQIHESIETLGRQTGVRSISIYGGVGINPQIQKLRQGPAIVVACPGRLLDHLGRGTVDLSNLEMLVIDEADQMFDMGFFPDIRRILGHVPKQRQTLFFSATMPDPIHLLAKDVLRDPVTIRIGIQAPADTVSHALYPVAQHLKTALLMKLLGQTDTNSVLVFTRTKHRAKMLDRKLTAAGYEAASLQGNLSQNRRQAALSGFKEGRVRILVATDIAARGIDVTRVSHVINYDVPSTPEAYIHRIGRTGRASETGEAFTLVTGDDGDMVRAIDRVLGTRVERRQLADFDYGLPDTRSTQNASPRAAVNASRGNGRSSSSQANGKPKTFSHSRNAAHGTASRPTSTSRQKRRPQRWGESTAVRSAA